MVMSFCAVPSSHEVDEILNLIESVSEDFPSYTWADLSCSIKKKLLFSKSTSFFSKNIIDSPLCACGAVENTTHFLLRCHRFNNLRQELFVTITSIFQPTSNILLYGAEYLTYTENKQIFLAVQEFFF